MPLYAEVRAALADAELLLRARRLPQSIIRAFESIPDNLIAA
jgi:hypothetical protein